MPILHIYRLNALKSINIAIFASGNGTNAQRIIEYFSDKNAVNIKLVVSNVESANVLHRANKLNVSSEILSKQQTKSGNAIHDLMLKYDIDFIVLAGYLKLIPSELIQLFNGPIINIHPALLPNYGGKGMYGMNVHEAVIEAGEKCSGISIHHVTENYDEGDIILQEKTEISTEDTPSILAQKIHQLEYTYFPLVREKIATSILHQSTSK